MSAETIAAAVALGLAPHVAIVSAVLLHYRRKRRAIIAATLAAFDAEFGVL